MSHPPLSPPIPHRRFATPQTDDGPLDEITFLSPSEFRCTGTFHIPDALLERAAESSSELIYVARSRVSRLGISLRPTGPLEITGNTGRLALHGSALLPHTGLEAFLQDALVPGVAIGRLIVRDESKRLSADQVNEVLERGEVKLPLMFSLSSDGCIRFQPQPCRYVFRMPLKREHLIAILNRPDGKELLNFLQVREAVRNVMLPTGEAVITSCAMFLQHHYFLLDAHDQGSGRHFHACVLDPLETRMSNVFLEYENATGHLIVNPTASGYLYEAEELKPAFSQTTHGKRRVDDVSKDIKRVYKELSKRKLSTINYGDRPIAILKGAPPAMEAIVPPLLQITQQSTVALARELETLVPRDAEQPFTAVCEFFPDVVEHPTLLYAAASRQLKALVFRKASYDHGPFLSERDHARLLEYAELGVEIYWQNDLFPELAMYTSKGRRGFFAFRHALAPVQDALVLGVYGSTVDLPPEAAEGLTNLLGKLYRFFGKNIAFLTGGGGGVMRHVLETGKELGCLVGSSFLENADQNLDPRIDFYQTFQGGSRHMRQRWFEVARCHLFAIGGIGTLEEIGMTLTDIKLGLINTEPVVLFGPSARGPYWRALGEQLQLISASGRGPKWLDTHVLITDDPDEALAFYQRTLQVG